MEGGPEEPLGKWKAAWEKYFPVDLRGVLLGGKVSHMAERHPEVVSELAGKLQELRDSFLDFSEKQYSQKKREYERLGGQKHLTPREKKEMKKLKGELTGMETEIYLTVGKIYKVYAAIADLYEPAKEAKSRRLMSSLARDSPRLIRRLRERPRPGGGELTDSYRRTAEEIKREYFSGLKITEAYERVAGGPL